MHAAIDTRCVVVAEWVPGLQIVIDDALDWRQLQRPRGTGCLFSVSSCGATRTREAECTSITCGSPGLHALSERLLVNRWAV